MGSHGSWSRPWRRLTGRSAAPDEPTVSHDRHTGQEQSPGRPPGRAGTSAVTASSLRRSRPSRVTGPSVRKLATTHAGATDVATHGGSNSIGQHGVPAWLYRYGLGSWLTIGIVIVVGMVVAATLHVYMVFIAVFLALVVTSVLYPVVSWLARFMPRALAMVLTLLGSVSVVLGLLTYIVASVAGQWDNLARQFGQGIDTIFEFLESGPLPVTITRGEAMNWINERIDEVQDYVQSNAGDLAGQVLSNAGTVALVGTVIALGVFLMIFFLLRGESMWRWFLNQLPAASREKVHTAAGAGWYTFSGYARGTFIVASFDGVLAFILLIIVQVPLAAPLAVLVFIGAFIPLIGAPLAMIIAAIVALAANGFWAAIIVTIGIALIGQIEGNILQPLVMGKQVSLHPVVVAIGVTAGTFLGGLLGAVIAIPLLAVIWAVYAALRTLDPPLKGDLPSAAEVTRTARARNRPAPEETPAAS